MSCSEVISTNIRVSRKDRICDGCREIIPKGNVYASMFQEDDGHGFRNAICHKCTWVMWNIVPYHSFWSFAEEEIVDNHAEIPPNIDTYEILVDEYVKEVKRKLYCRKVITNEKNNYK